MGQINNSINFMALGITQEKDTNSESPAHKRNHKLYLKRIGLSFTLLLVTAFAMGQIKVTTNGNVGIGTNNTSNGKLVIASNGAEFAFHASNKSDGKSYFGSYNTKDPWINFYHPKLGYNKIRFKAYLLSSDSTLKTDITQLEDVTPILKQIRTYSYYFKSDSVSFDSNNIQDIRKKDYGVLAQELKTILPDLVDTCNNEMFVNYNAFISILIKGFNEQQALIETLQNEISDQKKELEEILRYMYNCCGLSKESEEPQNNKSETIEPNNNTLENSYETAILYQNAPNPFSSNTKITCYLPEGFNKAMIHIYNLQGVELKSYPLTQAGLNDITVNASELSAGMYLYTLMIDNKIIDTKRMILTK